ncbi:MAG: AAA family ATPase [Bryobacteraceae bacterium]
MEPQLPFVGMASEIERLNVAFGAGHPLLLLGPQGSGKTRLIEEALRSHQKVLYIAWQPTLHALLAAMARTLIAAHHPEFLRRAGVPGRSDANPEAWLAVQTSIHLKGLLWTAVEGSPVTMMLDGIARAGFPTYRFLQRISQTPGVALFAASRDAFSLGALARLFWNPAQAMNIPPLPERDSGRLFEAAADHFRLRHLDLDEFREKVLESARGNPGQIVEMCRLATQPQYQVGRYIKFSPLRIDTVMKFAP